MGELAAQQQFDDAQGGLVAPLEVVEHEQQRAILGGERAEQAQQQRLEAPGGLGGLHVGDLGLRAEHRGEGRYEVADQARDGSERGGEAGPPGGERGLGFGEAAAHELLDRTCQGGVGDVALRGIEVTAGDRRAGGDGRRDHAADQCRLTGAGGPADEHEPRLSGPRAGQHGVEDAALLVAAEQLVGQPQLRRDVGEARRERVDEAALVEVVEAALQVRPEPAHALVAGVGALLEQLEDHLRERGGQLGAKLLRGRRHAGEVAVHEAERVIVLKREAAGEQLVERDAEGVVVTASVDGAAGATGLLGRHVLQGALAVAGVAVAGEGGGGEVDEHDATVGCDEYVARLDVAMQDLGGVHGRDGAGEAEREAQALDEVGGAVRTADPGAQRGAVDPREDQRGQALPLVEGERADHLGGGDPAQQRVLLAHALGQSGGPGAQLLDDDGEPVAASPGA